WSTHSGIFLLVTSPLAVVLGGPMLLHPMGWARTLGWKLPKETDLAVYFGRCLGGVVTVLSVMGFVAAGNPSVQPFFFTHILAAVGVNILVHLWGALQRIQPVSETVEIGVWIILFISGLLFFPVTV
ncbi:MAG: hypothetical protein ACXWP5_13890, partial [Bdellovibrionota bacterium]